MYQVFKDGDGSKAAWFSANVLSLKDQKAYVCYVELPSDEGKLLHSMHFGNQMNVDLYMPVNAQNLDYF